MARKKQEIALQVEINSQDEWKDVMQKEGLYVIDVYQDWCGPCKAVLNTFRRIKNETGDDLLNFAIAKADTIDSLEKYRGKCEPCFLFYGGGSLVSVIRGANPPLLEETIKTKLQDEHKVMSGDIERNEVRDPLIAEMELEDNVEVEEKDVEEVEREVTLALIKPDVVKAGKVDEIIEKLKEAGIEILAQQERKLTDEEARNFYHHMENEDMYENLIQFICSGPSYVLVLAKGDEGIISEFRELIGPKIVDEAKEVAPDSLRALYGSNAIENAIHGADNRENALRELAFFFPDFAPPKIARHKEEQQETTQRTLALIRPAAYTEFKDSILDKIKAAGFSIAMTKEVQLTKEEAALFYKGKEEESWFDELTTEMSKGTLLAVALEKQNAVGKFRDMLGPPNPLEAKEQDPKSLRAQFSNEDIHINLIHGSDSVQHAAQELQYFFPIEQTVAAIKPDGIPNRDEILSKIHEAHFTVAVEKEVTLDQETAENLYCDQKDQEYYTDLIEHMLSGPTLFLVLSREDAIRGWRSLIGPKDPAVAQDTYPDCIRSIYGADIKSNAVYGSDNKEEAKRIMDLIFGELEFTSAGNLTEEYKRKWQKDEKPEAAEATEGTTEESKPAPTDGETTEAAKEGTTLESQPAPTDGETTEAAKEESKASEVGEATTADEPTTEREEDKTVAEDSAPKTEAESEEKPSEDQPPPTEQTEKEDAVTEDEQPQTVTEGEAEQEQTISEQPPVTTEQTGEAELASEATEQPDQTAEEGATEGETKTEETAPQETEVEKTEPIDDQTEPKDEVSETKEEVTEHQEPSSEPQEGTTENKDEVTEPKQDITEPQEPTETKEEPSETKDDDKVETNDTDNEKVDDKTLIENKEDDEVVKTEGSDANKDETVKEDAAAEDAQK